MLGIIGAMDAEIDGIKEIMTDKQTEIISGIGFVCGKVNGIDIVIAKAGIGKVNAAVTAQIMIMNYKVEAVINIGVAGAIDNTLRIGDIVVADSVVQHDMDITPIGFKSGFIDGINRVYMKCDDNLINLISNAIEELTLRCVKGVIASGDIFVADNTLRTKISTLFGASCAEMEGAAIGQVCVMNNVPFAVLSTMSDGADDDARMNFEEFAVSSAKNAINIILNFLDRYSGKA